MDGESRRSQWPVLRKRTVLLKVHGLKSKTTIVCMQWGVCVKVNGSKVPKLDGLVQAYEIGLMLDRPLSSIHDPSTYTLDLTHQDLRYIFSDSKKPNDFR